VNLLTHLSPVADLAMGGCPGVQRSHPSPDVLFRLHANVKLEFFINALVPLSPAEQRG
jgi:hypothetical protein